MGGGLKTMMHTGIPVISYGNLWSHMETPLDLRFNIEQIKSFFIKERRLAQT